MAAEAPETWDGGELAAWGVILQAARKTTPRYQLICALLLRVGRLVGLVVAIADLLRLGSSLLVLRLGLIAPNHTPEERGRQQRVSPDVSDLVGTARNPPQSHRHLTRICLGVGGLGGWIKRGSGWDSLGHSGTPVTDSGCLGIRQDPMS